MTIENLFVRKYEKLEKQNNELEKKVKGLEIDLLNKDKVVKVLTELIEKGYPKHTAGGFLSITIFLNDSETKKYVDLLNKLNIQIEGEQK